MPGPAASREPFRIRPERPGDLPAIATVNTSAFGGPEEAALVDGLRSDGVVIASLVAEEAGALVGHILFSRLSIHTAGGVVPAAGLAPMAVLPERQRQGIGRALVGAGLEACRAAGERIVIVVGHRSYYPRFGFSHALAANLRSVYQGESFMALELQPRALEGVSGEVQYPPRFDSAPGPGPHSD